MENILMPEMGENIKSAVITRWHRDVGENIEKDEILFEISTDKVESEIPSPVSGKIDKILFEEGDECVVGTTLAIVI